LRLDKTVLPIATVLPQVFAVAVSQAVILHHHNEYCLAIHTCSSTKVGLILIVIDDLVIIILCAFIYDESSLLSYM